MPVGCQVTQSDTDIGESSRREIKIIFACSHECGHRNHHVFKLLTVSLRLRAILSSSTSPVPGLFQVSITVTFSITCQDSEVKLFKNKPGPGGYGTVSLRMAL
jgi:hypothetical protein